MSNPPKAKGTKHENEVLGKVLPIFPNAERAPAGSKSRDLVGTGCWTFEVKHRRRWELFKWISKIRDVADDRPWCIVATHGDRNSAMGRRVGSVAIVDLEVFVELLMKANGGEP